MCFPGGYIGTCANKRQPMTSQTEVPSGFARCEVCGVIQGLSRYGVIPRQTRARRLLCVPCLRETGGKDRGSPHSAAVDPYSWAAAALHIAPEPESPHIPTRATASITLVDKVDRRLADAAKRYGVSIEFLLTKADEQSGLCAICAAEVVLVVDHDHDTGLVRGLLCGGCNTMLGRHGDRKPTVAAALEQLRARSARLEKALAYLEGTP